LPSFARSILLGLSLLSATAALAAPRPPATARAARLKPDSSFRSRFLKLASDPAHGGAITRGSFREAYVGLRLETRGVLPGRITRDRTGAAEFVDGTGVRWDVKGFNSQWPAKKGGFVLANAGASLAKEIAAGQNVILDGKRLSTDHAKALDALIQTNGWQSRVVWYASPGPR